jgi:UDP-2,3-diacylglucosamine pyrophosphatase LpxH
MSSRDHIFAGLSRVLTTTADHVVDLELDTTKSHFVILSDQHKGQGDKADNFRKCKATYDAALVSYHEADYTLLSLGDVEELWECRPEKVVRTYRANLELEARFHAVGRYHRFWGNHDDVWMAPVSVNAHLGPLFPNLVVREGARLRVRHDGAVLGTILLLHGHQGTCMSDRNRGFARWVIRNLWRPFQRLTGCSATTPAKDATLRGEHDRAMAAWAEKQNAGAKKLILIAGHTHRPVFMAKTHAQQLAEQIIAAEAALAAAPAEQGLGHRLTELRKGLASIRAQEGPAERSDLPAWHKPCYFNTGCCSFPDGDVTGIELDAGELRLVRWPDDEGRPRRKVLAQARLEWLFDQL